MREGERGGGANPERQLCQEGKVVKGTAAKAAARRRRRVTVRVGMRVEVEVRVRVRVRVVRAIEGLSHVP